MIFAGEEPIEESGAGASDVEIAGGRRGKTHAHVSGWGVTCVWHGMWLSVGESENFSLAEGWGARPTCELVGNDAEEHAGTTFELHVVFVEVQGEVAFGGCLPGLGDFHATQVVDTASVGRKDPKSLRHLLAVERAVAS